MHAFVDALDFEGMEFDMAIRTFLAGFRCVLCVCVCVCVHVDSSNAKTFDGIYMAIEDFPFCVCLKHELCAQILIWRSVE